jgi:hypothetical protein
MAVTPTQLAEWRRLAAAAVDDLTFGTDREASRDRLSREAVPALLNEVARLRDLLRMVEWTCAAPGGVWPACPACGGTPPSDYDVASGRRDIGRGHAPDCPIAAALR